MLLLYCCAHSHCSGGHRGLSQSTAALRANPRSLYLCFFPATIDLLMASNFSQPQRKLVFSKTICRKSLDCKCQSFRSSFPLRMILFIYLLSCLRMVYRCTTKLPQGIKNFIRKCKVDTAGRLIKYHFDGYDCSARASATRNIYKASPLISDDRNVAL